MPFWLRSIAASSVRSFGIVLLRLAERVDRFLVIALRLQRLAEASPRLGVAELEIGPRAAELGRAPPVARLQHPRTLDLEHRSARAALGELGGERRDRRAPSTPRLAARPATAPARRQAQAT